ncbi:MAG: hypothetical protein LLF75_10575 [Eubacteriales bacterium]|nr:hypothetical protein [Eubacteriales bacterium]
MQFESLPEKRAVPSFVRKVPAQSIVLELMKAYETERDTSTQKFLQEQKRADELAVSLALQVYRKRGSDDTFVRSLAALLADRHVQMLTYEGEALTPELESAADIIEWLPADGNTVESVAEAIEPEIRAQERILHRAKLSCRKAPVLEPERGLEQEPEQAAAEAPVSAEEPAQAEPPQSGEVAVAAETATTETPSAVAKPNLISRIKAIWKRLVSRRNKSEKTAKTKKVNDDTKEQESAQEGSEIK